MGIPVDPVTRMFRYKQAGKEEGVPRVTPRFVVAADREGEGEGGVHCAAATHDTHTHTEQAHPLSRLSQ